MSGEREVPGAARVGLPDGADGPNVLLTSWEGVPADELARRWGVPALHLFDSVGSTNDVARSLAAAGAEPGTTVLAERQVAGRGRAGRAWDSPSGAGLWLSMIAPPPVDAAAAGILPLRVGIAVARALDRFIGDVRTGIKWPNDLLIGPAKVAGVLCEGSWEGDAPGPVIVGVGINVNQRPDDLPPEVRHAATSVAMAATRPVRRLEVADAVIPSLLAELRAATTATELGAELADRDVLRGRSVIVTDSATGMPLHVGVAMGIAPDGALMVRGDGGALRAVRSGTVRTSDGAGYSYIGARR